MPYVYTIANQKGGTGKTTVTTSLAAALARQHNQTVLVIDMDGQCNATTALLGRPDPDGLTIKNVLWEARPLSEAMQQTRHHERLWIVPGSTELAYYEKVIEPQQRDDIIQEARHILKAGLPDSVDIVLIDTGPTLGTWLSAALAAADAVIVVSEPKKFSTDGIAQLFETIEGIRDKVNPELELAGFILNHFRAGVFRHEQYIEQMRSTYGEYILEPIIRVRQIFDDCQSLGTPVEFVQDRAAAEVKRWFGQIAESVLMRQKLSVAEKGQGSTTAPEEQDDREVALANPEHSAKV
jgi:chromosome partitioning protein